MAIHGDDGVIFLDACRVAGCSDKFCAGLTVGIDGNERPFRGFHVQIIREEINGGADQVSASKSGKNREADVKEDRLFLRGHGQSTVVRVISKVTPGAGGVKRAVAKNPNQKN
jgi:hypothetical protein